jgi:enoyl-[acyl-carrier protein] reductase III
LPHYGLIGASKAALESLVRHLALEMGNQGVNVNCVLAGLVETDSTRGIPGAETLFAAVKRRQLTGERPLRPVDVANCVLFLASELSDQVQGHTFVVDGGEGIRG